MMTSSNGNIFRINDPLWGESTSHWWIPLTAASERNFDVSPICTRTHALANNRDAGDLRRNTLAMYWRNGSIVPYEDQNMVQMENISVKELKS